MNKRIKVLVCAMTLSSCFFALEARASIYKCVDTKGVTYYSDKTCPLSDEQTKMKAVKDPRGGYVPPVFVEDKTVEGISGVVVGNNVQRKLNSDGRKNSDSTNHANSSGKNPDNSGGDISKNSSSSTEGNKASSAMVDANVANNPTPEQVRVLTEKLKQRQYRYEPAFFGQER